MFTNEPNTQMKQGKRRCTPEYDLRLSAFFAITTGMWMNLQLDYEFMRLFLDCAGHVPAFPLADMSASGKAPTCRSSPPQRPFSLPAGNTVAETRHWNEMDSGAVEGVPVVPGRPGRESRCWLSGSAGEEARAEMKAMMEQFRATETAMRLSELKANVCYLGPRSDTFATSYHAA
jgi:hypothetical protein